ncbi:hypothetical protein BDV96DRAFT_646570 [Lophiotrema nucula]|uniref:Homeobox domain-containing protein n=1 Tax=Lophiotrema nucula TaxID=690887 RepID=A0A6A5ZAV6_9PLEO|nr:hypothetical protein BDV96DRAFT_646570 [Lophiotrema nucula]
MFSHQAAPLSDQAFAGTEIWLPTDDATLSMTGIPTMGDAWSDFSIDQSLIPGAWEAPLHLDSQTPYSGYQPTQDLTSITQHPQGDDGGDSSDNGRKKRRRIPLDTKKILDDSFEHHKDDPYAPVDEIKALSSRTGLSVKQVRTYFANARARRLPPASVPKNDIRIVTRSKSKSNAKPRSTSSKPTPIEIPGSRGGEQQDPMQRFLSISPEDEGVSEEAVRQAAEALSPEYPLLSPITLRRHSSKTDAMSIDSGLSSNSGGESSGSQASVDSVNSRGRRRGRKRQREPNKETVYSLARKPVDSHKKFQCTFCSKDFAQKYDWKRHEESVHFPQQEWICMPDGATYTTSDGVERCAFCDLESTCDSHLSTHNHTACATAPRSQRTFLRKDKLIQHLIQVHRYGHLSKSIQTWCRPIERTVVMVCGLCCAFLPDWSARADHLAAHFNDGITMQFWLLGPGGITPVPDGLQDTFSDLFKVHSTDDGKYACHMCSDRFASTSCTVAHKRQEHKSYSNVDRTLMLNAEGECTRSKVFQNVLINRLAKDIFGNKSHSHGADGSYPAEETSVEHGPSLNNIRPPTPIVPSAPPGPTTNVITPSNNIVASSSQSLVPRPQADWSGFYRTSPPSPQSRVFLKNVQLEKIRQSRSGLSNVSTPTMGVLHTMEQLPATHSMELVEPSLDSMNTSTQQRANSDLGEVHRFDGLVANFNAPRNLHNKRFSRLVDNVGEDSISGTPQHPPVIFGRLGANTELSSVSQGQGVTRAE